MSKENESLHGMYRLFLEKVLAQITPLINDTFKEKKEIIQESFEADLFGLDRPETDSSNINQEELFLVNLFFQTVEIHDTFEKIKECKYYISVFPFNKNKISRSGYFTLINESLYHELYILRERLTSFLPTIIKSHKGSTYYKKGKNISDRLSKDVKKAMRPASNIRDIHVHRRRIEEKDIKILASLELLQLSDDKDFTTDIRRHYIQHFSHTRNKLKTIYTKAIEDTEELLDYYFWALDSFFFNDASINYPPKDKD